MLKGCRENALPSVLCYLIIIIWGFKYGAQPPSVLYKRNSLTLEMSITVYKAPVLQREDIVWESYHYALILSTIFSWILAHCFITVLEFVQVSLSIFSSSCDSCRCPSSTTIYKMSYLADVSTSAIVNDLLQITDNICNPQDNFVMLKLTIYYFLFCFSEIRICKNTLIL